MEHIEVCQLPTFVEMQELASAGEEIWRLSDGSEAVFDALIQSLSILLNTIVICPF